MKKITLFPLLGCAAVAALPLKAQSQSRPNIVLVLCDDLGCGDLGCYDSEKIETPNIDRLAQEGMRFTNYYTGSPVSAPARCTLLTGEHSGHAGVRGNDEMSGSWDFKAIEKDSTLEGQRELRPGTLTLPTVLQRAGYATGMVGKWGLGEPGSASLPNKMGFDFFYGYICQRQAHTYYPSHLWRNDRRDWLANDFMAPHKMGLDAGVDPTLEASYDKFYSRYYSCDTMHVEAMNFLKKQNAKPFFLYYATPLPHVPLQAPKRLVDYYHKKFGDETYFNGGASDYFPTRYPKASYAAMVTYIDENVGDIVKYLKQTGQYDNTIFIITSDNGPTWNGGTNSPWFKSGGPFKSEHYWGKCSLREGGIREPLVVSWTGHVPAGSISNLPCASYDMMKTVQDVLGGTRDVVPADGISFLPTLKGEPQETKHEYLYWEFMDDEGQQAVRWGNWKGFRSKVKSGNLDVQLYDLSTDSTETTDVAATHPSVVAKIKEIMMKEHDQAYYNTFRVDLIDNEKKIAPSDIKNGLLIRLKTVSFGSHESFFNGTKTEKELSGNTEFELVDANRPKEGTATYYLKRVADGKYVQAGTNGSALTLGTIAGAANFKIVSCKGLTGATLTGQVDENTMMFVYDSNGTKLYLNCQSATANAQFYSGNGNKSTWNVFSYGTTGTPTGVAVLPVGGAAEAEQVDVYSATGLLVRRNITGNQAFSNLPRGLYFAKNKKVRID